MSSSHAEPVRHKLRHKAVWNLSSWNAVEGGEGTNLVKKEAKCKRQYLSDVECGGCGDL